jgi:hypothetical protein
MDPRNRKGVTVKRVKPVGIAILAAMALTALLGTASASASQFRAEEYPATISSVQVVQQKYKVGSAANIAVKCDSATASGTLAASSSSITLTPAYSGCQVAGQFATANANSCKYVFNSTNEAAPYSGSMDIACSKEGDGIIFTQATSGCEVKFPAQTALGAIEFANTGSNRSRAVTGNLNISGVKNVNSSKCAEGGGTFTNGTLAGSLVVKGTNAGHGVGVYLNKEQVEDPPMLEGESYPLIVQGSEMSGLKVGLGGVIFNCSGSGAQTEISGRVAEFGGSVAYGGCGTATMQMNGCSFTLHPLTSEAPLAAGSMGISCKTEGGGIILQYVGGCKAQFSVQSIANSVKFQDLGTGSTRYVHVELSAAGLKYTEGAGCPHTGTHTDGSMVGSWDLKGYKSVEGIPTSQEGIWVE